MIPQKPPHEEMAWQQFFDSHHITPSQQEQLKAYYELLVKTNDIHNLTAITDVTKVINDHFEDSLALAAFMDLHQISMLADIGTGAGFPALPLKILYPHLTLVLIEVNHKKISFLQNVLQALNINDSIITDLDWRTFLRKTHYPIEIFCARASLQPEELIRMFKPSSPYKDAQLIYWASQHWQPAELVEGYIQRQETYIVGDKQRKLVFFRNKA